MEDTSIKKRKGIFEIVHIQRGLSKGTNYIDYVCTTPREVLLLVTTLKAFANPIGLNDYTITYTNGENNANYSLEDIEKLINNSLESAKIDLENKPVCKVNETYKHESSPGTPPPL